MKKLILFSISLVAFWINPISGQEEIQYGSNNGQYISIQGTQIYYEEYGKGTPLLMFHGGTGLIEHYKQVIPELSNHFRVIAVDSPGHGRSEHPDTISYQLQADYFSEFIDKMELDSVYIIGWSCGGNFALLLAADRPDKVKRVMISGANIDHSGYTEAGMQWTSMFTPEYVEEHSKSKQAKDYEAKAYKGNNWSDFISDCAKMWAANPYVPIEKINKIKCKLLIVLGDRDSIVKLDHGVKMYRLIKGSEFLVLPNTGHMVFWDKPELITHIGIEFFNRN